MPAVRLMSQSFGALSLALFAAAVSGCGSGGGGGYGNSGGAPALPAYINGTTTGQYTNGDLGFYLGAHTTPTTVLATTTTPKIHFDIGNGNATDVTNVHWRVLQDGTAFTSGTAALIGGFAWVDIEFNITAGAGTHVYRIEIDDTHAFTETNENNNFVELTVAVPASG